MNGFYWLASYPKSGNTWLRLFLEHLLSHGADFDLNHLRAGIHNAAVRQTFDRLLDMPSSELTEDEITRARPRQFELEAAASPQPLLRKVHDAWRLTSAGEPLFPPALTRGVIYLVRDPRDVAASLAHHIGKSIDDTIERMNRPAACMEQSRQRVASQLPQLLTTWSGHVSSWQAVPVPRLLLRYEDMLADPFHSFSQVVRFLGYTDISPARIHASLEAVRFDRLQSMENRSGFAEKPMQAERFFRRGIAGGWQDSLTPEQARRITTDHGDKMRQLGYWIP